jgi:cardiolipin synthase
VIDKLTLLRILITPIITLLILKNEIQKALALLIIATSSDAIDGYLARTLKKKTKLGAYLDPIADKILNNVNFINFK